ncbi:MAG: NAD(P)/FAD-dependent oxidoreductase [Candidatus Altiarchaeota archaeon]
MEEQYDVVVVGAGPAGLSAAITAAYYKVSALVIESAYSGGAPVNQYPWKHVDNYLGVYEKTGAEAAKLMTDHALNEGVKIRENETVTDVRREANPDDSKEHLIVTTNKGRYSAKAVVLACGLGAPRKLGVGGETLDNVVYCLPDPGKYRGKKAIVVGGGDTAVECAVEMKKKGTEVVIVHRKDTFRATDKNVACVKDECVNVLWNTEIKKIEGMGKVERARLFNNKDNTENVWDADVILFSLGTEANTEFLKRIGVKTDDRGRVTVNADQRTNLPGIFAAGDIVGKWIRIPQAVGEGGLAGLNAFKYVKNPYWG